MAEPQPGGRPLKNGKQNPIQRPLFQDLPTAYSSITSRPGYGPRPKEFRSPVQERRTGLKPNLIKSDVDDETFGVEGGQDISSLHTFKFHPHQSTENGGRSTLKDDDLSYSPKDVSNKFVLHQTSPASSSPVPKEAGTESINLEDQRQIRNLSESHFIASLYGDNQDFINLSHNMPSIAFSRSPSFLSGKASSGVLAEDRHEHGGSPDSGNTGVMRNDEPVKVTEVLDRNDRVAGTSSNTLESDIARELRRVSRLSNLSGSIMLFDESRVHHGDVPDSSSKELGPGSSQSSSIRAPSDEMEGYGVHQQTQYTTLDIPKMWMNTERAGKGNFAKSFRSSVQEADGKGDDVESVVDDDGDGDWETIAETGAGNRMGSRPGIGRELIGSSLADNSSDGSLSPENRNYSFLDGSGPMRKHPPDERYDHVYRIRHTTPHGEPMLFPAYNFEGGIGFPNRNALTSPVLASPASSHHYQHPTPLSTDHAHPFKSSPPVILSSGRAVSRSHEGSHTPERTPILKEGSGGKKYTSHVRSPGIDLDRSSPNTFRQFDFGFSTKNQNSISVPAQVHIDVGHRGPRSPYIHGGNGSFAKVTTLGPRKNITGTPQGTGMREVGSSLADASSSPQQWDNTPQNVDILQVPGPVVVRDPAPSSWDRDGAQSPASWQESVRRHREHLVAEGLLPRTVTPPGGRPGSLFSRNSSPVSISLSTYDDAFRPVSYNPTPPLPRNPSQQASELEFRLRRFPRENSSFSPKLRQRKKKISWIFLALCCLFPPMCLIYGYGYMDEVMLRMTNGDIECFGKTQKKVALVIGWSVGSILVLGIIIGMVIYAKM